VIAADSYCQSRDHQVPVFCTWSTENPLTRVAQGRLLSADATRLFCGRRRERRFTGPTERSGARRASCCPRRAARTKHQTDACSKRRRVSSAPHRTAATRLSGTRQPGSPASDAELLRPHEAPPEDRPNGFKDRRACASRLGSLPAAPAKDVLSSPRCPPEGTTRSAQVPWAE